MSFQKGMKGYFIGIGGVGVNALAKFALDFGLQVSGSDIKPNKLCRELENMGAYVSKCEDALTLEQKKHIENADFLCFSSAISKQNPELCYAIRLGKRIYERHELLGEFSRLFGRAVAIGGTHGKTSTTAMLVHILKSLGIKFVGMLGGEGIDFSNYVNNTGENTFAALADCVLVCEACEYKKHLLSIKPSIAIVTNAELDHPDSYSDINGLYATFAQFLSMAETKILPSECAHLCKLRASSDASKRGFDVLCVRGDGTDSLRCIYKSSHALVAYKRQLKMLRLCDGGEYNYHNAALAIVAAAELGISCEQAVLALGTFKGVKRRFEYVGSLNGARVYFDFAHHPSELVCAISRAKRDGRLMVVFQPHTYSRTRAYLYDFAKALASRHNGVKLLALMPTYAAREQKSDGVDSDVLAMEIFDKFRKKDVYLMKNAQSTVDFVKSHAKRFDTILMLGAGDIYDLRYELIAAAGSD